MITVSVCMITYNHEKYIKQTLQNINNQKVNFNVEIVIANDASTDLTSQIINEFIPKSKFPVKFINQEKNVGMMPNFLQAIQTCSGKYVALCEGDDFWTNENKLQKQVDFLEQNDDFSICFHPVQIEENNIIIEDNITFDAPNMTDWKYLAITGNYMHTCSVMYRNNLIKKFPEYFKNSPIGDYYLHLLNSQFGKIYKLQETMGVYRVHDSSYWSSKKQAERELVWIEFLENCKKSFTYRQQYQIEKQILKLKKINQKKNIWQKLTLQLFFFFKDDLKL